MKVFLLLSAFLPLVLSRCCHPPATFEAKIKLLNKNNDRNGDGKIELREVKEDLDTNYDTNKDGKVSKAEFAINWNCIYGDELGFGLYFLSLIDRNKDGFVEISDVAGGPIGKAPMNVHAFEARNRQRYTDYSTKGVIGK